MVCTLPVLNLPPSFGLQFFSHVAIDGATEVMTVRLKDVEDPGLWSTTSNPFQCGESIAGRRIA
jgi:hypothetical protein